MSYLQGNVWHSVERITNRNLGVKKSSRKFGQEISEEHSVASRNYDYILNFVQCVSDIYLKQLSYKCLSNLNLP